MLASDLAVTEIVSALARRVREGAVRVDVARRVQLAILESLDDGVYGRLEISRGVHRRAEHFLATLTGVPLRAADALHLALATLAQAASLASFDVRLRTAGRSVGLVTYPD